MFDKPGPNETVKDQQTHGVPDAHGLAHLNDEYQFENRDNDEQNKKNSHFFDHSDDTWGGSNSVGPILLWCDHRQLTLSPSP